MFVSCDIFSLPGHVASSEKLKHEAMDEICYAMRLFWNLTGHSPGLWKADIDAAFRRVPLNPQQRWCCGVAFMLHGKVVQSICVALFLSRRSSFLAGIHVTAHGLPLWINRLSACLGKAGQCSCVPCSQVSNFDYLSSAACFDLLTLAGYSICQS